MRSNFPVDITDLKTYFLLHKWQFGVIKFFVVVS